MGKFSNKLIPHTFVSLEEMICDVVDEYEDKESVGIYVPWDEVSDIIVALLSTGLFKPISIEWAYPEMNGYGAEYLITINDDGDFFVEPIWNTEHERYLSGDPEAVDAVFVSERVDINLIESLIEQGFVGMIHYNIED